MIVIQIQVLILIEDEIRDVMDDEAIQAVEEGEIKETLVTLNPAASDGASSMKSISLYPSVTLRMTMLLDIVAFLNIIYTYLYMYGKKNILTVDSSGGRSRVYDCF
jgi:hypothetical protein